MAKRMYLGVDGLARKVKKMYLGVEGTARKVKKGYIGVGGVARPFFSGGELAYYGVVGELGQAAWNYPPAAASVGDYALAMGGMFTNSPSTSSWTSINVVFAWDKSLTVTNPTPLSGSGKRDAAGGMNGGYALCICGRTGRYNSPTDTIEAYDPSLTRQNIAQTSVVMQNPCVSYNQNYMLVANDGTVNAFNASFTRSVPAGMHERRGMAAATAGEYAMYMGGMDLESSAIETNYVDAYNQSLTRTSPQALAEKRIGGAGGSISGKALAMGGYGNSKYYDGEIGTVEVYNESLTRSAADPLSIARRLIAGVSTEEQVYAMCGYIADGNDTLKTIDAYDRSLVHTVPEEVAEQQAEGRQEPTHAFVGDYLLLFAGDGNYPTTVEAFTL